MKTFARATLMAAAIGMAGIPAALADRSDRHHHGHSKGHHHGHHHAGQHHRGGYDDHAGRTHRVEVVRIDLDEKVRNSVLPLRKLAGLDRAYHGHRLLKVVIHLRPTGRKQRFDLIGSDYVLDRAKGRHLKRVTLRPDYPVFLGETVRSLQLGVRGTAKIRSIEIALKPQQDVKRHKTRAPSRKTEAEIDRLSRELGVEIARILLGRAKTNF